MGRWNNLAKFFGQRKIPEGERRGSFLIEVLLTIVILSVGLTLIVQSMISGARAMARNSQYTAALLLAENKIFEFLNDAPGETARQEGQFPEPFSQYAYLLDIPEAGQREKGLKIREVDLKVGWGVRGGQKSISLATYFISPSSRKGEE